MIWSQSLLSRTGAIMKIKPSVGAHCQPPQRSCTPPTYSPEWPTERHPPLSNAPCQKPQLMLQRLLLGLYGHPCCRWTLNLVDATTGSQPEAETSQPSRGQLIHQLRRTTVESHHKAAGPRLQSHRLNSSEDLEKTILRYVTLYNQQLPQSALASRTPLRAITDWHKLRHKLFNKQI